MESRTNEPPAKSVSQPTRRRGRDETTAPETRSVKRRVLDTVIPLEDQMDMFGDMSESDEDEDEDEEDPYVDLPMDIRGDAGALIPHLRDHSETKSFETKSLETKSWREGREEKHVESKDIPTTHDAKLRAIAEQARLKTRTFHERSKVPISKISSLNDLQRRPCPDPVKSACDFGMHLDPEYGRLVTRPARCIDSSEFTYAMDYWIQNLIVRRLIDPLKRVQPWVPRRVAIKTRTPQLDFPDIPSDDDESPPLPLKSPYRRLSEPQGPLVYAPFSIDPPVPNGRFIKRASYSDEWLDVLLWQSNFCIEIDTYIIEALRLLWVDAVENMYSLREIRTKILPTMYQILSETSPHKISVENLSSLASGSFGTDSLPEIFVALRYERPDSKREKTWILKNFKWSETAVRAVADAVKSIPSVASTTGTHWRKAKFNPGSFLLEIPSDEGESAIRFFINQMAPRLSLSFASRGGLRQLQRSVERLIWADYNQQDIIFPSWYEGLATGVTYAYRNGSTSVRISTTVAEYPKVRHSPPSVQVTDMDLVKIFNGRYPANIIVSNKYITIQNADKNTINYFTHGLLERNVDVKF